MFIKNQKLLEVVNGEDIGSLETLYWTKASESLAEGDGIKEGIAARKAQFNLITRNAKKTGV